MLSFRHGFTRLLLGLALVSLTHIAAYAEPAAAPTPAPVKAPPTAVLSTPQQVVSATADKPFVGLWFSDNATLSDDILTQLTAAVRQQEPNPDHIVVFVHGFDTSREASTQQFTEMSKRAIEQYKKRGKRVACVGVQWLSYLGPPKLWVIKVLTATLGLDSDNPYLAKVALAQNIGRTGGRQMMATLNQQFPQTQIDVMAHSLGCDLARNMLTPFLRMSFNRKKYMPALTPLFAPDLQMHTGVVSLAGADLDYDLLYQNREASARSNGAGGMKLVWLTIGGVKNPDRRDLVLSIRALARGDRAMGNTIPRMGRRQIDAICSRRGIVFDGQDIPMTHDILKYYDVARMTRIVGAAVCIKDPSVPDPLLTKLSEIINAPADCKTLQGFFSKNNDLSVTYYTLWRLEGICCGGPRHLSDGYLEWLGLLLGDEPADVAEQRWKGPCLVVRQGWWPTERQVYRATERQFGQEGRPQFIDRPLTFPQEEF